jgi:isopentenyl diphosphate isomerase/L-lactate dehydrogenase-like FMN-dependent dehydrogenase
MPSASDENVRSVRLPLHELREEVVAALDVADFAESDEAEVARSAVRRFLRGRDEGFDGLVVGLVGQKAERDRRRTLDVVRLLVHQHVLHEEGHRRLVAELAERNGRVGAGESVRFTVGHELPAVPERPQAPA